jgi:predicted NAD/FAD-binding protein
VKVAVVGSGIAGLSAAWLLSQGHEVTVFEKDGRIGGHSHTVDVERADGRGTIAVDTGFIVYNQATYPNLCALFEHLDVATELTDMSFGVSVDGGRLEYSANSLFAQRRNLLRPSYLFMLRDIVRFYRESPGVLADPSMEDVTLGEYLARRGYGVAFARDHLLPMGAAIWSAPMAEMAEFPIRSFVRFFANHGLLQIKDRPPWFTVSGGSREYVARLTAPFADRIRAGVAVRALERTPDAVRVATDAGAETFDEVVLACHSDQALGLLADASEEERRVLSAIRYQPNRAVLHRDPSQMPRRTAAWSAWNYLADGVRDDRGRVAVTYWMNALQNLDRAEPLFVTLNPLVEPDPALVVRELAYDHPLFDRAAVAAQGEIGSIQGVRRTWFCGAWCGYGFHEDGIASGLAVAEALGRRPRPWTVVEKSNAGANAAARASRLEAA